MNPLTHTDSFENDAEIQIFVDHTEAPALRIPFWNDGAYDAPMTMTFGNGCC